MRMEQIHFSESRAKDRIQTLFRSSRLIPFFGSGFTKDAHAKRGKVPDAEGLTALIKKACKAHDPSLADGIDRIKTLKHSFRLLES